MRKTVASAFVFLKTVLSQDEFEFSCNFDSGLCYGWESSPIGEFEWERNSGPTATANTGPAGDHTSGHGYYMYAESSRPRQQGDRAILYSPVFQGGRKLCASYWYHMNGTGMGDLIVTVEQLNGSPGSIFNTQFISGNKGPKWKQGDFDVDLRGGITDSYRVQFMAKRGTSYASDMAIDDIQLISVSFDTPCPNIPGDAGTEGPTGLPDLFTTGLPPLLLDTTTPQPVGRVRRVVENPQGLFFFDTTTPPDLETTSFPDFPQEATSADITQEATSPDFTQEATYADITQEATSPDFPQEATTQDLAVATVPTTQTEPTTTTSTTPTTTTDILTTPQTTTEKATTQATTTQKTIIKATTTQAATTQKPTTQKPTTQEPTTQATTIRPDIPDKNCRDISSSCYGHREKYCDHIVPQMRERFRKNCQRSCKVCLHPDDIETHGGSNRQQKTTTTSATTQPTTTTSMPTTTTSIWPVGQFIRNYLSRFLG